jgi:hypothetical protein
MKFNMLQFVHDKYGSSWYVRTEDGELKTMDAPDTASLVDGKYIMYHGAHHAKPQYTIQRVGTRYVPVSSKDNKGKRIAMGTADEMRALLITYARML